jgi:AraC-like DNA-binding protein
VALRWGFWHLGGFSRAYKECFAERPSETLRRAQRTRAAATLPQVPEQRRR